jgi:hypothetical protein
VVVVETRVRPRHASLIRVRTSGFRLWFWGSIERLVGLESDGLGNDTIVVGTVENLTGSDLPDVLRGDANPNTLFGGNANDPLFGQDGIHGNDMIDGGAGIGDAYTADSGDTVRNCPPRAERSRHQAATAGSARAASARTASAKTEIGGVTSPAPT